MNAKTQQALKDSIAHWERMLELKTYDQRQKSNEEPNSTGCALCRAFFENRCKGCPVFKATKERFCAGSETYLEAHAAFHAQDDAVWQKACKAQIAFLKSLLPTKP